MASQVKSKFDSFNYHSYKKPLLLLIHLKISLLLLLLTSLDLGYAVWAQQAVFGQDSYENTSNQTGNRLDAIIQLLEQSRQGSIIQLNLTIIVFMMGLAFVIFLVVHWTGTETFYFYEASLLDSLFCTYRSYHCYSCKIYSQCSVIWHFKQSSSECCILSIYLSYSLVSPNDS